jgi:glyoxylase-like metal-dependent hydrolase (beta-lactamase superfamily II)
MFVEQIKVGDMENFCYLLSCENTGRAALIDPGWEADRLLAGLKEKKLHLEYILCTHFHPDHTLDVPEIREKTGAPVAMHRADIPYYEDIVDLTLNDGDVLSVGEEVQISVIHTPGHTPGGVCFYTQGRLFTGDTLFVGDSGRTDLPYGHRPTLGASLRKIMELPEETMVLPGHDYGPTPTSTLRQEMRHNINAEEYGFYKP